MCRIDCIFKFRINFWFKQEHFAQTIRGWKKFCHPIHFPMYMYDLSRKNIHYSCLFAWLKTICLLFTIHLSSIRDRLNAIQTDWIIHSNSSHSDRYCYPFVCLIGQVKIPESFTLKLFDMIYTFSSGGFSAAL